jgi:hypothetical protein
MIGSSSSGELLEGLGLVNVGVSSCALCCLKGGGGRWSDVFGFPYCFP